MILPCSVQNFKMILQLTKELWSKQDLVRFQFEVSSGGISYIATAPTGMDGLGNGGLIHRGMNKMAAILQTTLSGIISWYEMLTEVCSSTAKDPIHDKLA